MAAPSFRISREPGLTYRVTEDGSWARACDKASETPQHIFRVHGGLYRCKSSDSETTYLLLLRDSGEWECSCPARGWCYHLGKLAKRLARDYRAPRLSDFPESGNELFDGDDEEEPVEAPRRRISLLELPAFQD